MVKKLTPEVTHVVGAVALPLRRSQENLNSFSCLFCFCSLFFSLNYIHCTEVSKTFFYLLFVVNIFRIERRSVMSRYYGSTISG